MSSVAKLGEDVGFPVIAMASSAGGLKALSEVLSQLPGSFPGSVLVVQHLDPQHRSLLADILGRRVALEVMQARGGEKVTPGTIYVAPPDHHLLVEPDGTISLSQSALVHFVRPSADLLFETVATTYGARAIAIVLTGTGSDGSLGVEAIKKMGGTVIVQDEATSEFFGMPNAAIRTGAADYVVALGAVAPTIMSLIEEPAG